jgi:hypothetical protein
MIRSFLTPLAFAAGLVAQVQTTAYVQESAVGGYGNIAPLGCNPTGIAAAARSQILIPAQYLPGPGAILLGLGALGRSSAATNTVLTYGSLRITVSRTNATSLNANFASNLPAPELVLNVSNLTVDWQANAYTPITFSGAYVHDGVSSLVIDIQKIVNPVGDAGMQTIQNARRTDLPRMINALGTVNSGANQAVTATVTNNSPIALELRWAGAAGQSTPTVKLKSDPVGPLTPQFAIGRPIDVTVQGAPNSFFINLESLTMTNPGSTVPGILGTFRLGSSVTLNLGLLPASGQSTLRQDVPSDPNLVGLYLAYQSVVAAQPLTTWRWTNAADCILNAQ